MVKILIPRSDSISAKTIVPTDFEKYFADVVVDYVKSGFAISAGTGLAANVALGVARVKGLYVESDSSETISGLTANSSNYIYITLNRDGSSEAESWDFTVNTTGVTPTDSMIIGIAVTDGTSVTSVNNAVKENTSGVLSSVDYYFGNGSDGDVTISADTEINYEKNYNNLTINSGQTLYTNNSFILIRVKGKLIVNGTLRGGYGLIDNTATKGDKGSTVQNGNGTAGQQGNVGIKSPPFFSDKLGGNGGTSKQGGTGGSASSGQTGGAGGSAQGGTSTDNSASFSTTAVEPRINSAELILKSLPLVIGGSGAKGNGGGGGGAGGSNNYNFGEGGFGGDGGDGGRGGGTIIVVAREIEIGSSGVIKADGEDGSNGNNGQNGVNGSNSSLGAQYGNYSGGGGGGGASGGGGGGAGGLIVVIYQLLTNNGSITANGGSGGSGGVSGGSGGASGGGSATAGTAGTGNAGAGSAGQNGYVKQFQI